MITLNQKVRDIMDEYWIGQSRPKGKRELAFMDKGELEKARRSREIQQVIYPDMRQETEESRKRNRKERG